MQVAVVHGRATMPTKMAAMLTRIAVLVVVAALAACAGGIVGAYLIDGTGGEPIPDSVIVIRDDRIVAAAPRESTGIPAGAEVVDAAGQTVIPGLVDMHAHYGADADTALEMLRTQLYYGVTTARSIGTDSPEQTALILEANAGRPDTSRLFTAGRRFTHPGGFNAGAQQPTSTDEVREMVRALAGQGVHFVKMWVNEMPEPGLKITPEMRTAIVDDAITNGLVPVAHIDEQADGRQLIEAGLSDFLHSTALAFGPGSGAPMDDPEPSAEFIRMCLDNNVLFTPTLSIVQNNWQFAENPELLADPDLRAAMNPQAPDNFEDRKAAFRQLQDFVTTYDAGVRVALGTDSATANVPMDCGRHHEMELYVEAGLTPMEAIVAATATSAGVTPPVGEAEFGTLETGTIADLVVLDVDPLEDIRNTLAIHRVMKGGEWLEREASWPLRYRPYRPINPRHGRRVSMATAAPMHNVG